MNKFYLFIIIQIVSICYCRSQNTERLKFIDYLITNELYYDASFESKSLLTEGSKNNQLDMINFLIGKSYFDSEPDTALYYFSKIDTQNEQLLFQKKLLSSFLYFESGQYSTALVELDDLKVSNKEDECIVDLLSNSISIMSNKLGDSTCTSCLSWNYQYRVLKESRKKKLLRKRKSSFIAASLSSLIPGLGKVYAGQKRQGLSTFTVMTVLGLQSYEAYRKGGRKDTRFIISASILSLFYIGNVWGSAVSVGFVTRENDEEIHNDIVTSLRIPISKLYHRSR